MDQYVKWFISQQEGIILNQYLGCSLALFQHRAQPVEFKCEWLQFKCECLHLMFRQFTRTSKRLCNTLEVLLEGSQNPPFSTWSYWNKSAKCCLRTPGTETPATAADEDQRAWFWNGWGQPVLVNRGWYWSVVLANVVCLAAELEQSAASRRAKVSTIGEVPYTQTDAWLMAVLAKVVGQVNGSFF